MISAMAASVSSVACARAPVTLNLCCLCLSAARQDRGAQHQQDVADDRSGERSLHHRIQALAAAP